jgi:hypothetical protein
MKPIHIHPIRLLHRLGISDGPAAVVITITICMQYLFLAKLWEGYPIAFMGDVIHQNVVLSMIGLTGFGAVVIAAASLRQWQVGTLAASKLEQPAKSPTFDGIRSALARVAARSTLLTAPSLLYTPKNAKALEVRERNGPSGGAVVVGLDQRAYQRSQPAAFDAMLGHEISHIELAETRFEIKARRAVALHFRILGWTIATFCLVLGFIDRRGISSTPSFGGFVPVFDGTIYAQLSAQFAVLVVSSAIVFVYSYFLVVRREHMHDLRGSQLAGTDALVHVFAAQPPVGFKLGATFKDFLTLHPSPRSRARVIKERDLILLSTIVYPLVVTGLVCSLQPLTMLMAAGWRDFFGAPREVWNLGLTVTSGVILYTVLCSDFARLGLGLLLDAKRSVLFIPIYALLAGIATQFPRIILEILFGLRRDFSFGRIAERIWTGTLAGGGRIVIMIASIIALLACLNAIRIAAVGEVNAGRWSVIDRTISAVLVIGVFTITSLSTPTFILYVLTFCLLVFLLHATSFAIGCRCINCGRRRFSAMRLTTHCRCGQDHLILPKLWTKQPFEVQLNSDPG